MEIYRSALIAAISCTHVGDMPLKSSRYKNRPALWEQVLDVMYAGGVTGVGVLGLLMTGESIVWSLTGVGLLLNKDHGV